VFYLPLTFVCIRDGPFGAAASSSIIDVTQQCLAFLQVSIKGCRSEVKVYTDLTVGIKGVGGAFGIGLLPTIGLVCERKHSAPTQQASHRLL
jgi:hypothetical protein